MNLERAKLRRAWLKSTAEGLFFELKPYLNNSDYMEGIKVAGLAR